MNNLIPSNQARSPAIQVARLVKNYPNGHGIITVLREVNLKVDRGQMVAVMGPSGSGKSSLLFILGLLMQPTRGSYWLSGDDVLKLDRSAQALCRRQRLGFVFQTCDLMENSAVYENLEIPLIYAGLERRERPTRITAALEKVNLGHRFYHSANHLSGGERQRVAIARALVNQPQVILADEPTGQLDRDHSNLVMDHFEDIVAGGETAIVIVTHDAEVAARCTRIYSLQKGVLYECGP